jgi:lipopolysaccharide export system protein LptA
MPEVSMIQTMAKVVILLLCLPSFCLGLPTDTKKPVYIKANNIVYQKKKQKGRLTGNVKISQGTSHLQATKVITYSNKNNQLRKAVATGSSSNLAHFWTKTAAGKPLLHAFADKIIYLPEKQKIKLFGNAKIEQGQNKYMASNIIYDILLEKVVSRIENSKRTTIIIADSSTTP